MSRRVEPENEHTGVPWAFGPRAGMVFDLVVATVLLAVAYQLRRHGLPTSGLWLDDTVEAAAAKMTSLGHLFTVGGDHPGFILLLAMIRDLGARSDASLAYPALVTGTIAPPLLFLALRRLGFARSLSVLLSAALAAAQVDVIYSGRLKTHVVEPLIVLGVAVIVSPLARKHWRLSTAVGWVCATILLGSLAGYVLVAVTVAGIVIATHPVGDFMVRIVAVGVQAVVSGALYLAESGTYNSGPLASQWRHTWDAFPSPTPRSVLVHLGRVAETFPGGPLWLATAIIIVVVAALAIEARKSEHAVLARYLLLLLIVALIGGVLGMLPFGPKNVHAVASGMRVSIWLAPVVAIGLAFAMQRLLEFTAAPVRAVIHTGAYVGAAVILSSALTAKPWHYPFPGAKSAAQFVQSTVGPRDMLVVPFHADYSLVAESSLPVSVAPTPHSSIGFRPSFTDKRVIAIGLRVNAQDIARRVSHAERILVYRPEPPFSATEAASVRSFATTLSDIGFDLERKMQFAGAHVEVWNRSDGRALGSS